MKNGNVTDGMMQDITIELFFQVRRKHLILQGHRIHHITVS